MNPFPALVKETRYCSGADLKTLKEQLEGRSPAFPAPWDLLCCGAKQPVPWSRAGQQRWVWSSSGRFL